MKTSSHFSSKNSALVLGTVFTLSIVGAGVSLAQNLGLNIPTNLSNASITIQKIFLSSDGVSKDLDPDVKITLDGTNGNTTIGGEVRLTHGDFSACNTGSGCILRIINGKVQTTSTVMPWFDDGAQKDVIMRSTTNPRDTYYATPNGEATVAGTNTAAGQQFLRVGVTDTGSVDVVNLIGDTAMIVAGSSEIRGNMILRKANGTTYGNEPANQRLRINSDAGFTEMQTKINPGKVTLETKWQNGSLGNTTSADLSISAANTIFSADSTSQTKVGINTPSGTTPQANLQVAGTGTFLVGDTANGNCCSNSQCSLLKCTSNSQCSRDFPICTLNQETNDPTLFADGANHKVGVNTIIPDAELHVAQGSNLMVGQSQASCDPHYINYNPNGVCIATTLVTNSTNQRVGINMTTVAGPQKNLDVQGTASISENLIIGHTSTHNPGTDKLAVNGTVRANRYVYNSDRRYKSDIEVLSSPLANLLKISGNSYYNNLSHQNDIGVIAQEVEAVYPELVQTDADGYKSVAYGNLVAPIIEAIRELATKIDNLFTLYVSQQAKIDTLEARLLKLEAQVK